MHKIPFDTQSLVNQGARQTEKSDHVRLLRDVVRQIPKRRIKALRRLRTIANADSYQEPAVIETPDAHLNKSVVHDARPEKSQVRMIRLAEHIFSPVIPYSSIATASIGMPYCRHRTASRNPSECFPKTQSS